MSDDAEEIFKELQKADEENFLLKKENAILRAALSRFKALAEADHPGYGDSVIIRCEVTAADVRAMVAALATATEDSDV